MTRRSYGQFCSLAKALDVVGERWTLLILRELMLGSRRYSDLLEALPGISTTLLSERLKHLESHGVVRRAYLPPPAASSVYEMTERGAELKPALRMLSAWGTSLLTKPQPEECFRPEWLALYLQSAADLDAARGVHDVYEFRIDGHVFHFLRS